jgi:hypothetical protein
VLIGAHTMGMVRGTFPQPSAVRGMASHADDHARAKRLLEEISKLSSSVENVLRCNGEPEED